MLGLAGRTAAVGRLVGAVVVAELPGSVTLGVVLAAVGAIVIVPEFWLEDVLLSRVRS